jgi:RNA polymerase sigma factor (sigma-70 family)
MACTATQLSWKHGPAVNHCDRGAEHPQKNEAVHRDPLQSDAGNHRTPAFERLYEQTAPKVLKTLYRITRNQEDAEDALQEAFLSAFVHARDFDGRSSFTTWFTRIAINSALMILRKKRTHPEYSLDEGSVGEEHEAHWVVLDTAPNPERRYAQQEREAILREAVGDLRPAIRRAVEIGQLQDRTMRETAEVLGISVAAAKARLFHARAALRRSRRINSMSRLRFPVARLTVRVSGAERWERFV